MMKVVSATALLAAAGAANAAFFEVRSVDTESLGSPIIVAGTLFQSGVGGDTGPNRNSIDANANLAFDSYVAIDLRPSDGGTPAKGDGFTANPGDLSLLGSPFDVAGQIGAVWFMNPQSARPEVGSIPQASFAGADGLFLGRFSFRTQDGSTPTGGLSLGAGGVVVDIRDPGTVGVGSPATDSLLVRFTAFNLAVQSGLDGGSLTTHPTANAYELRVASSEATVGGNRYLVQDLYVVQIPTPGALALFGAAGLAAARRRRA